MNKLDPRLKILAGTPLQGPQALDGTPGTKRARALPDRVQITVKYTGALADLTAAGFNSTTVLPHPTAGFAIATGSIPLALLSTLADIEHVVKIEGARPLQPDLDKSIPEINAGPNNSPASEFTGQGVVIGIIDSGFDFLHPVFRRTEGGVRILAIWDQSLDADELGLEPPQGFSVGVEFTEEDIDEALGAAERLGTDVARSMVPVKDVSGHGTAVASIAAGNGSIAGNCRQAFTYVGVAPDADLILVRCRLEADRPLMGESANLIDAFHFIFQHPRVAGRPVVINLSMGDNLGSHDGTSLSEQAIDILLQTPGRAIVKSAGNEASARHHAAATVPRGGTLELEFEVMPDDNTDRFLELWYPGSSSLVARVTVPVVPEVKSKPLAPGDAADAFDVGAPRDPTTVTLEVMDTDPDNGDRTIGLKLSAPVDGNHLPAGRWILELRNPTNTDVPIDAWINRGENSPEFTDHVVRATTVSIPGTAASVITVAAYSEKGSLEGNVDRDSGRGPTRRKSTVPEAPRLIPDIAAPGGPITVARPNKEESGCSDCCVSFYAVKGVATATSFAAPHVSGAIALMFEKNPSLTARAIKEILRNTASPPVGSTDEPLPNTEWGTGRLDVSAALDEVPEPGRGGGGSRRAAKRNRLALHRSPPRDQALPPLSRTPAFTALRQRAQGSSRGQLYAVLVSRYFSEVRGLIRANRRVAVVWRRIGGPELIAHLARRVFKPELPLPVAIGELQLTEGMQFFLELLRQYGSPDLKRDIDRYGRFMLAFGGCSLNQILSPPEHRQAG